MRNFKESESQNIRELEKLYEAYYQNLGYHNLMLLESLFTKPDNTLERFFDNA